MQAFTNNCFLRFQIIYYMMPRNATYSVLGPNYDNAAITSNIPEQEQAFGSGKSASQ